jgi:hypothetical protein
MIYAELWDELTMKHEEQNMALPTTSRCGGRRDKDCRRLATQRIPPTVDSCYDHINQPFFVRPAYVGHKAAREIVESWYEAASRIRPKAWNELGFSEVERVVCYVAFFVGLDPTAMNLLKELRIGFDTTLRAWDRSEEQVRQERDQHIRSLLRISNKKGFKLHFTLKQRNIRMNLWPETFACLKPIVSAFKAEGAEVKVEFKYNTSRLNPPIELNVLPFVESPNTNWRQEADDYFDKVRQSPRHYPQ